MRLCRKENGVYGTGEKAMFLATDSSDTPHFQGISTRSKPGQTISFLLSQLTEQDLRSIFLSVSISFLKTL